MYLDMQALPAQDRYKVLTATVTPRPIAWVTTRSGDGVVNAAPFSFFNVLGHEPPTVALGILGRDQQRKDTATNILESSEFVVNLVSEATSKAMNVTCIDAPPEVDELQLAGLIALPSTLVKPPRIAESPVSFECRTSHAIKTSEFQLIVLGEIIAAHIDDAFVQDADRYHIDTPAMRLIGRMHGRGWYARTTDLFNLDRPSWQLRQESGGAAGQPPSTAARKAGE